LWLCGRNSKLSQESFERQGFCEYGDDTSGFVKGGGVPLAKQVCSSKGGFCSMGYFTSYISYLNFFMRRSIIRE
jgi:hypothetical protein